MKSDHEILAALNGLGPLADGLGNGNKAFSAIIQKMAASRDTHLNALIELEKITRGGSRDNLRDAVLKARWECREQGLLSFEAARALASMGSYMTKISELLAAALDEKGDLQ